ncbi:MAG: ATP-binding protein [Myxococcota bacterium]|nr:ATP-binding protein [Myxococcota bacterium]
MFTLVPFVAGAVAADVVLFAVFVVLFRRERKEHLAWWAAAWGFDAARHALNVADAALGGHPPCATAATLAVVAGAACLLTGTTRFTAGRLSRVWLIATLLVGAWTVVAYAIEVGFVAGQLPPTALLGLMRVVTGAALLRARKSSVGGMIAGVALVLWGVHAWNYPFLRPVDWFAPWGFQISALLGMLVAIGTLLLHSEQARDAERASAARYQELFENVIEGAFRTSTKGRFLAANPALVRMLGYEHEHELLELDLMRDVYAEPADRARILAHQDGDTDTVKVKRRDGEIIEVEVHARRSRDASGEVRWLEGSMRDVTEEKRLREELAQAQRMEALGRMAGGIAHDFNNVLGTIVAATELAKLRLARGDRVQTELDDVLESALRAAALTRQLLALGRRQPRRPCALDLRTAVGATARVAGRVLGERVRLSVELGSEPQIVVADPAQLDQLLTNLALNARDAMPDGGELAISLGQVELDGRAHARIRVEDDGVGMTEETRSRMFDPFFTTKPYGSGTGLGLAMVYGAVTQAGGRIEVESAVGRGTRIDVLLPIATGDEARLETSETSEARDGSERRRSARILLVEDEPALRRSIEAALREAGHDVRSAEDGAAALAHVELMAFDLLVTDVVMPGLTGTELARAVRARLPACGVVYVSGYAADRLEDAMRDDAELLAKPFTIDALISAVSRRIALSDAA